MDNTGRENGDQDQRDENAPDEAATPSGWVVTKEAPEPTEKPARAKPGRTSTRKKAAKTKPARARQKPSAARRTAGGKKKASPKAAKKTTARTTGKKKAARKGGKRKVR